MLATSRPKRMTMVATTAATTLPESGRRDGGRVVSSRDRRMPRTSDATVKARTTANTIAVTHNISSHKW
jgi:hypothetical protein